MLAVNNCKTVDKETKPVPKIKKGKTIKRANTNLCQPYKETVFETKKFNNIDKVSSKTTLVSKITGPKMVGKPPRGLGHTLATSTLNAPDTCTELEFVTIEDSYLATIICKLAA